ncbi:MAG TPA: hypothetical protein VIL92_13375, partial [Gaiellaceae bacterium]
MRRAVSTAVLIAVLAAVPGALGKPVLGITGNHARFKAQTTQESIVHQAFLGWGQGQFYGAPFAVLLKSLGPIPMLHLGTAAQGNKRQAVTPATIAAGKGDSYLGALNLAIAAWGQAIYIRPMAEMNNRGNPWSGTPAAYRKAFARIYVLVHGGPTVPAKLAALGLPAYKGPTLATNAFPRVRVLWSPLAGGEDAAPYWPGDAFVDVGGADIYKEAGEPPWTKFEALFAFAKTHGKPFAVPEWGLFHVDDPTFVQHMCDFLKSHVTEMEAFYESKPGSMFDLSDKPGSRGVYKRCITPLAAPLPAWARGGPGSAKQIALKLTPDQDSGDAPLDVTFSIIAQLSVPIVQWQVVFGDSATQSGQGPPPDTVTHTYA